MTTDNRQPTTHRIAALAAILCFMCTTDHTRRGYLRTIASTYDEPSRPVIVIPGFGVTRLLDPVRNRYVWGTAHSTVQRGFEDDLDLPVDAEGRIGHDRLIPSGYVGSRGPVNIGWQLMEGLRKFGRYTPERNVFGFQYDWRLRARENAAKLDELVDRVRGGGKVDLVTHSAGAIVALTYIKLAGGASKVEHLVLVAPTQRGVIDAFRVIVRPERFIRRVFTPAMVLTWPAVPELLPDDGRFLVDDHGHPIDRDLWQPQSWRGIVPPSMDRGFARSIADARSFRDELARQPMPKNVEVTVIAGDCVATARRVLMRRDGSFVFYPGELRTDERSLERTLFEPGDGTVPVTSSDADHDALLFCDGHQGIAADPSVHRAIIRTLREQARR
jgi:pimeloyl-ACP methyl ester carboxylesterase